MIRLKNDSYLKLLLTVLIIAILTVFISCSNDDSDSNVSGDYVVYGISTVEMAKRNERVKAYNPNLTTNAADLIVLPSGVAPPPGYIPDASATVTFSDGTTIEVDKDASFDLDDIPDGIAEAAMSSIEEQPEIIVNSEGKKTASTIISMAKKGTVAEEGDVPIGLKIIPDDFMVITGDTRSLEALRINSDGKIIKATNVTWTVSPAEYESNLVVQADSAYALFTAPATIAGETEEIEITASILSQSHEISVVSFGTIISDVNGLVKVYGNLYDTDGTTPLTNTLLSLDLPPRPGRRPFHFFGFSNSNGYYEINVMKTPPAQIEGVDFNIVIVTRNLVDLLLRRFYRGIDIATGQTYVTVLPAVSDINADIKRSTELYPVHRPLPLERIIRTGLWQMHVSTLRLIAEPENRIRDIFLGLEVPNPIDKGVLWGWTWTLNNDGTVTLLAPFGRQRVTVTKTSDTSYDYVHEVLPAVYEAGYPFTWLRVTSGRWTDTLTGDQITAIEIVTKYYFPLKTRPFMTIVNNWEYIDANTITLGISIHTGDIDSADSKTLSEFEVTREFLGLAGLGDPLVDMFTYDAAGTYYVHLPWLETPIVFSNDMTGSLKGDLSGGFIFTDTTVGGEFNGSRMTIDTISPFSLTIGTDGLIKTASGSIERKEPDSSFTLIATFDVYLGGLIKIYPPEDPEHLGDPVQELFNTAR